MALEKINEDSPSKHCLNKGSLILSFIQGFVSMLIQQGDKIQLENKYENGVNKLSFEDAFPKQPFN